MDDSSTKIYLNVPYNEVEYVKKLGALWDSEQKKWYIFDTNAYKYDLITRY